MEQPGKAVLTWKGAPWVGGTLFLLLVAVILYAATGVVSSEPSRAQQPDGADIAYGPGDANVVVLDYSDFECEVCAQYAPVLADLRAKYKDQVRWVYRFFPLDYHRYGMISSQAAYAAHLQGKFWEMHDLLYENQKEWAEAADPSPHFEAYAARLGLDIEQFREDIDAVTTKEFITRQQQEGVQAGVDHTPWFVINESAVTPRDSRELEALIQEAL